MDTVEVAAATKKVIEGLGPAVDLFEAVRDLIHLKDPYKSIIFLLILSWSILHLEAATACALLALMIMIQYNAYYHREYEPPAINYIRNAQFLLQVMNLMNEGTKFARDFTRDVLYWGNRKQSVLTMNLALFGSIPVYISLRFLPIRLILVTALWVGMLRNSDFCSNLGKTTIERFQRIDFAQKRKKLEQKLVSMKDTCAMKAGQVCRLSIQLWEWPIRPTLSLFCSLLGHLVWVYKFFYQKWAKRQ